MDEQPEAPSGMDLGGGGVGGRGLSCILNEPRSLFI